MSRTSIPLPTSELAARYEAGESTYALGTAYGVGHMTIWRRLAAAGFKMRGRGGVLGNKNRLGLHKRGGPLHIDEQGYLGTYDRDGKKRRIHRGCWEAHHGPVPDGSLVHHIAKEANNGRG